MSFIFLELAARQISSSLTVSFILKLPVWVGWMIIFALVISQIGMTLSPSSIEFYLNQSQHSIQMLTPFLEGTYTSYLSFISFFQECFSLSFTEANMKLLRCSLLSLARLISSEAQPKLLLSSSLQGSSLGEVCALFSCFILMDGFFGTGYSSDELLPNYYLLFTTAYFRRKSRQFLYFSLSFLNSVSGSGVFLDESVLEPSLLIFCLMMMGCLCVGWSSPQLDESENSFLICITAYFFLAFLSARQSCRCFLNSELAAWLFSISVKLKPVCSCMHQDRIYCIYF